MTIIHACKDAKKDARAISRIFVVIVLGLVALVAVVGAYWYVILIVPACLSSVQGYALYIHVVKDSTAMPVPGATVSSLQINDCGNSNGSIFTTQTFALTDMVTPANGTVRVASPPAATYSVTVHYSGSSYNTEFTVAPLNITSVTISIPSGRANVTYSQPS